MSGMDIVARGIAQAARKVASDAANLREAKGPVMALVVGDSIGFDGNDNNANSSGGGGMFQQIAWRSFGRIAIRRNTSIPGQTSAAIAIRLFDEGLALPGLDVALILQGTNDVRQSIAQATTLRNDRLAIRAARARKVRPVLVAIPPNSEGFGTAVNSLNAAKQALATTEKAIYVDPWASIRQANGSYISGKSDDGIHPNQAAAVQPAKDFLVDPAIAPLLPVSGVSSFVSGSDLSSVVPGGDFAGTYTSGGNPVPNGWSHSTSAGAAWTTAVAADPVSGNNLYTATIAAGGTGTASLQSGNFDISMFAGQRVGFSARLATSGMAGSGGQVRAYIVGSGDAAEGAGFQIQPMFNLTVDGDGYLYGEGQVPAGATTAAIIVTLQSVVSAPAAVSFSTGEFAIRLTDMQGLDIRSRRQPSRIRHVAASATLTLDDAVVLVDATAGPVTLTLPEPGVNQYGFGSYTSSYRRRTPGSGLDYRVKKIDGSANAVTVAAPAGSTIEGAASVSLAAQWGAATLLAAKSNLFTRW